MLSCLSVLLIQLKAKRCLNSGFPTGLWRLSPLAYSSRGFQLPSPIVRAHSTRGIAASWVLFERVFVNDICAAASWTSLHTFVRFYRLDVTALLVVHSVLSAGSTIH